jgi:hypothetical protein
VKPHLTERTDLTERANDYFNRTALFLTEGIELGFDGFLGENVDLP